MTKQMTEQPGVAYVPDFEIHREDSLGKLVTVVDHTHFDELLHYVYKVSDEDKRSKKVKEPFHKMALKLIIYKPNPKFNEAGGSWKKYMDVPDFLRLADAVMNAPCPTDPKGAEIFSSISFNQAKGFQSRLIVKIKESTKNPGTYMFEFAFSSGEAKASEGGLGFVSVGEQSRGVITLPENQARRMFIESTEHIRSMRNAATSRLGKINIRKD